MGLVIGRRHRHRTVIFALLGLAVTVNAAAGDGKLLNGKKVVVDSLASPNTVRRQCLTPRGNERRLGQPGLGHSLLAGAAQSTDFDTTINCLVLRFNFQFEDTDDPNTTGRGLMDLTRPLDTLTDEEYIAWVGHLVDPPPRDSVYYDAHMRALNRYWEAVSGNQIHLTWDIYPPRRDSVYQLPYPMSHYGRCDLAQLVEGLEDYFQDCIRLADSVSPEIDFSQYGSVLLFHAGSDGQNDIGFPATCSDLFSGFIRFGGEVLVDDSTHSVREALMMPETAVQDNRATALNAVLAHEFGHQLGLVDLYNTENFFTQLGDFALMDNNGFGTGIDFGWPVGNVFGAIPLFPCAWSRAFLGIDDVHDLRHDTTGVEIVAAELSTDPRPKIARIPISENEYYLAEVRLEEVDDRPTAILADFTTSVIQGPVDSITREFTTEYDFLMPGSGMLIYHVDEEVAGLDYDGDGLQNFLDNDLQWYRDDRKFIRLVEADGLVHFGGFYYGGFGSQDDFFRDDLVTSFTPNSNPSTTDNSGNNTHLFIENIERVRIGLSGPRDDRVMNFDVEIDRKVDGFPIRAGRPVFGLAPIADDLDGDGTDEVIIAAGRLLSVVTSTGQDFIRLLTGCSVCPPFVDTVVTLVNRGDDQNPAAIHEVPLYVQTPAIITAGPVTGRIAESDTQKLVAVGWQNPTSPVWGSVALYRPVDGDNDARADLWDTLRTVGFPIGLSFGDSILYALVDNGAVFRWTLPNKIPDQIAPGNGILHHGLCRIDDNLVVLSSDTVSGENDSSWVHFVSDRFYSIGLEGLFIWGPVAVDLDLDGRPEIAVFTPYGEGAYISIDNTQGTPVFTILSQRETGHIITTDPIVGDVDLDGRPDLIMGGLNELLAFNSELILKTGFPREVDDRYPLADVIAPPIMADIQGGGMPELVFPTVIGNFYSYGPDQSYGFPVSSGEQRRFFSASSAVLFDDATGGKLGYLGGDGWFYAWEVEADPVTNFWPMGGGGPSGTFSFDGGKLPSMPGASTEFDASRFYNYPNPVYDGQTRIRYYLSRDAGSVSLNIFDLSGQKVDEMQGSTLGGTDNEVVWNCSQVMTGIYRCVIEIKYSGVTESSFTDIAVIQ